MYKLDILICSLSQGCLARSYDKIRLIKGRVELLRFALSSLHPEINTSITLRITKP